MAIRGLAEIFIEPDDQYTTLVRSQVLGTQAQNLISATQNQTLTTAVNKARDDLAGLPGVGEKHRYVRLATRVTDDPFTTGVEGIAEIFIEADDQYTTHVKSEGALISDTQNQTLAAAFNKARDDLGAMATGSLKHRVITIMTRID